MHTPYLLKAPELLQLLHSDGPKAQVTMTQVSGTMWGQNHSLSPSNAGNHSKEASEAWLSPLGLERAEQLTPWLWHSSPPLFFQQSTQFGVLSHPGATSSGRTLEDTSTRTGGRDFCPGDVFHHHKGHGETQGEG